MMQMMNSFDQAALVRVQELARTLPTFPDGRIDYTNAAVAAVLTCFVLADGKLLLLKRSNKVGAYQGLWHVVAGYLDEPVTPSAKAQVEMQEELQIASQAVRRVITAEPYEAHDAALGKTWIIHGVLAELTGLVPILLDWEHTDYRWIDPEALGEYETVPGLDRTWQRVQPLRVR